VSTDQAITKLDTLKALSLRCDPMLEAGGFSEDRIELLSQVFENWRTGGLKLSIPKLRQKFRAKTLDLDSFESTNVIRRPDASPNHYEPGFIAYCVLLVRNKRSATKLWRDMEHVLKTSKVLYRADPESTVHPLSAFIGPLRNRENVLDALHLLGAGGAGIQRTNVSGDVEPSVVYDERVFQHRNILELVALNVQAFCRPTLVQYSLSLDGSALSLEQLALAPEAYTNAEKALARLFSEPDSAISSAKAALESALKFIAHKEGLELSPTASMHQILAACKQSLALQNEYVGLCRALTSVMNSIAELRNLHGDSHATHPPRPLPTRSEARLVVGTALLAATFLLDRWEATRTAPAHAR
jgi:hypothetical protein